MLRINCVMQSGSALKASEETMYYLLLVNKLEIKIIVAINLYYLTLLRTSYSVFYASYTAFTT